MNRPALPRWVIPCAVLAGSLVHAQAPAASRLEQLAWMSGSWLSDSAGVRSEEHWMAPAGGLMVGMNRTVRDGRARMFEFLRIRERGDTIAYLTNPGGRPATTFTLTELGEHRVVFENPAHDFPQRIAYWLAEDGRLHARVDGTMDGRAMAEHYVWTRVAAFAPPAAPRDRGHE